MPIEEMNEIIKIVQALEVSNILLKEVSEAIKKNKKTPKLPKGGILSMLLGTLGAYINI